MRFSVLLFLLGLSGLLVGEVGFAQSTNLESAGVLALSGNFDIWPDFLAWGNNHRHSLGMAALGKNPQTGLDEFVVIGTENTNANSDASVCGWKRVVINKNGIVNSYGGYIGDDGTTDITHPYATGTGVKYQQDCCVRANRQTGEYLCAVCIFSSAAYKAILSASGVLPAAFNYWNDASPTSGTSNSEKVNFQRFARTGAPVSKVTVGRNIPASDELDGGNPDWVGGIRCRPAGCGILSDGNSFHGICTRSSNLGTNEIRVFIDPTRTWDQVNKVSSNPNYGEGNDDVTVFSVTNPAATAFVKSTTAAFQTRAQPRFYYGPTAPGFNSPKSESQQGGASDYINGWFALYQDEMIAVYNNAGTLIAYATQTNAESNPNGNSFHLPENFANATDRGTWFDRDQDVAAGGNRLVRNALVVDNNLGGTVRRMVMVWKVDPNAGTVTPMAPIFPDDDFNSGAGPSVNPGTNNTYRSSAAVDVDEDGSFVTAWRTAEDYAAVCRVYNADGTPRTGSFYVSSLEDPVSDNSSTMNSQDGCKLEVAISGSIICVVWTTDNGVANMATVDCNGFVKNPPVSQVARVFQTTANPTDVKDWDLYE